MRQVDERPLCPLRGFGECVGERCAWSVGQSWAHPDGRRMGVYTCAVAEVGDREGDGVLNVIETVEEGADG